MSRYMFSGDYIPLHPHATYAPNRVTRLLQSTFSLYAHALVLGKLHTEKSLMKCKFSVGRRSIKSEMLHIKSEMLHVRQAATAKNSICWTSDKLLFQFCAGLDYSYNAGPNQTGLSKFQVTPKTTQLEICTNILSRSSAIFISRATQGAKQ